MNKRIFSALLVLAMVFTFVPFAAAEANAAEAFDPATTVCSKCGSVPEGGWVAYAGQTTSGHYYIPEGYSLGGQINPAVGAEICINMNGQNVVTGNHRAFMLTYAPAGQKAPVLSLMGSGSLASGATTGTNDGDVIFMRHSNASNPDGGTLNIMDDVVLKNNGTAGSSGKLGGIVYVGDGCTVNMSGGKIDGSAKTVFTWEGGAIYMTGANARFNMTGGEIIGDNANCGGAVCAENGAKFTMSGSAIVRTVGTVSRQGGVFRLQGAGTELIINGGTITGTQVTGAETVKTTGTTDDSTLRSQNYGGGAIYATREAKITMTNGIINGANSRNGGAIYLADASMDFVGGTINGGNGTRGGAVFMHTTDGKSVLNVGSQTANTVANMNGALTSSVFNGACVQTNTANCTVNLYKGATLKAGKITQGTAACGGGAVYLAFDATLNMYDGSRIDGSTVVSTGSPGGAIYQTSGTFNMYGGEITGGTLDATDDAGAAKLTNLGGAVYISNGNFNMINGTISGGTTNYRGGAIAVVGGTFNQNGGTITGGKAPNGGNVAMMGGNFVQNGGAVTLGETTTDGGQGGNLNLFGGTYTMNGGSIEDGKSIGNNGGNMHLSEVKDAENKHVSAGTFVMNGGTVTEGTAKTYGGNIMVNGGGALCDINGGVISGGQAGSGGNIFVLTGSLVVDDAEISGGKATAGGNLYVRGTTTVTNTKFLGAEDATGSGQNVYVHAQKSATFNDCYFKVLSIKGGDGRNIYLQNGVAATKTTITLNNCILADNPKDASNNNGTNVWIAGVNTKVNLDGMTTCPQFYFNGIGDIEVGDDFVGQVHLRYGLAVGAAVPANLTYETGYADTGVLYQSTNSLLFVTNGDGGFKVSDTKYASKLGTGVGEAQINYRTPATNADIGGNNTDSIYVQRDFTTVQEAINAYALLNSPNAFVRIVPDKVNVLEFSGLAFNGGAKDNTLTINLSGEKITGIALAEGTTLEIMDSVGSGSVSGVTGAGAVASGFTAPGGAEYIVSYNDGAYHAGGYTLSTKSYLRTGEETLAFQTTYDVNAPVGGGVKEIGIKIYADTNGDGELEPLETVAYDGEAIPFVKDALETVQAGSKYNAAYVALDSQGINDKGDYRSIWWAYDITVEPYIVVATADGEATVYGETVTQNFQKAVLKNINNDLVKQMLAHGNEGKWAECDANRFAFVNA